MAGQKRKYAADDVQINTAPKCRKVCTHGNFPERNGHYQYLSFLQQRRPLHRISPILNDINQNVRLRALDLFPMSTDIDVHRYKDIDLAEQRQIRKLKAHFAHLKCCIVCLLPRPVEYINMPCGHMAHCEDCDNRNMRKCACCQGDIDHTVQCPVWNYQGCFPFLEWFGVSSSRDI